MSVLKDEEKTELLRHAERAMNAATDAVRRASLAYEEAKEAQVRTRELLNAVKKLIED